MKSAKASFKGNGQPDIGERHPERLHKGPVTGEQAFEILKSDPNGAVHQRVVGETQVERGTERNCCEDKQPHKEWRDIDEPEIAALLPWSGPSFGDSGGRRRDDCCGFRAWGGMMHGVVSTVRA